MVIHMGRVMLRSFLVISCVVSVCYYAAAASEIDRANVVVIPDAKTVYQRLNNRDIDNISSVMPHMEQLLCEQSLPYDVVHIRLREAIMGASKASFAVGCELHSKFDRIMDALVESDAQQDVRRVSRVTR